jgi:hypothetical protein
MVCSQRTSRLELAQEWSTIIPPFTVQQFTDEESVDPKRDSNRGGARLLSQ